MLKINMEAALKLFQMWSLASQPGLATLPGAERCGDVNNDVTGPAFPTEGGKVYLLSHHWDSC